MTVERGDRGLAEERTALAWQRTAVGLLGAAAATARLLAGTAGRVTVALLGVALVLGGWVLVESRLRSRRRGRAAPRGGRSPTALAVALVALAGAELAHLAGRW